MQAIPITSSAWTCPQACIVVHIGTQHNKLLVPSLQLDDDPTAMQGMKVVDEQQKRMGHPGSQRPPVHHDLSDMPLDHTIPCLKTNEIHPNLQAGPQVELTEAPQREAAAAPSNQHTTKERFPPAKLSEWLKEFQGNPTQTLRGEQALLTYS